MHRFRIAALSAAAGLALSAHATQAAGPPKELYNKSVVMHWSTGYNWKFLEPRLATPWMASYN